MKTTSNFTKELKSPSPEPERVSLAKLLLARTPVRDGEPTMSAAACLIKALHRNGGEPLRKASK